MSGRRLACSDGTAFGLDIADLAQQQPGQSILDNVLSALVYSSSRSALFVAAVEILVEALAAPSPQPEWFGAGSGLPLAGQEQGQQLLPSELAFLQCHRVGKVPLLPGTCYIEMARNMAVAVHGGRPFTLSRVAFQNIIFLDGTDLDGGPNVRLHADRANALVTISSQREGTAWSSNASLVLELPCAQLRAPLEGLLAPWAHSAAERVAGLGGKCTIAIGAEIRVWE